MHDPIQQPIQDPLQDDFVTPPQPAEVTFEQLDTHADGYVLKTDVPAGHELSAQFAEPDTNGDSRLSRDEFDAFMAPDDEEEAEE